ncbi:hypothetical protein DMJ13_20285 [halophilic archaeon]|nr:hypothetical protein DMJ13_20285 [halophilic archaeon]
MGDGMVPTEEYDDRIRVVVLNDKQGRQTISCASYPEAIAVVKDKQPAATAVKIENRDGEIVFTSDEMDIHEWEQEWKRAKRRLSVDVEKRECPYDNTACFADDLCVQCQIDQVQAHY